MGKNKYEVDTDQVFEEAFWKSPDIPCEAYGGDVIEVQVTPAGLNFSSTLEGESNVIICPSKEDSKALLEAMIKAAALIWEED